MQPNYSIFKKRTRRLAPYNLAILAACLDSKYEAILFDPNFMAMSEKDIRKELRLVNPDIVGITSCSTEYVDEIRWHTKIVKQELPEAVIILGGVFPTVMAKEAIQDVNVDYLVMGEGEYRFPALVDRLNGQLDASLDGIVDKNMARVPGYYIEDLDSVPFPDYGNLDMGAYANLRIKYASGATPRKYSCAYTITSRGCPFGCIFCAARTISGSKVRMRSSKNVLEEIERICNEMDLQEMIFLDDHFLFDEQRAIEIMEGMGDRSLSWKCVNVAVFSLTPEILEIKRRTGCYQIRLSLESGVQDVLKNVIRKPVDLSKAVEMISIAKSLGFEIISNFVIGFPGETWDQIRKTIDFAERLDIDLVNFHIATPLPKTKLMDICIREGFIVPDEAFYGYTKGVISTNEFSAKELQTLRAFEWDRINFSTDRKKSKVAEIQGITLSELAIWRKQTRGSEGIAC